MAVTKFHEIDEIETAYAAGLRLFGENRIQELESKFPAFLSMHPDATVHMIGHLQSNKAKKAVSLVSCIESVDSVSLLQELDKRAKVNAVRLDVLLELHTGEESKSGFMAVDDLMKAIETTIGLQSLRLRGLMTMAPYTTEESVVRQSFRLLCRAFEKSKALVSDPQFNILSMGMTNDFEIAIEEGSTLVRIGTAIFGQRPAWQ
jgi:hypothetical protein